MKNQYAANYPMAYEMASQLAKYGNQKQDVNGFAGGFCTTNVVPP